MELPRAQFWEFRFIPVCGNVIIANGWYRDRDVFLLDSRFEPTYMKQERGIKIYIKGRRVRLNNELNMDSPLWATGERDKPNQNPNSLLSDYWFFDSDATSHESEPEHQITWLNEYVDNSEQYMRDEPGQYEHLAYAGVIARRLKKSTRSAISRRISRRIVVKIRQGQFTGLRQHQPVP